MSAAALKAAKQRVLKILCKRTKSDLDDDEIKELSNLLQEHPKVCQSRLEFRHANYKGKWHVLHQLCFVTDSMEVIQIAHDLNPTAMNAKATWKSKNAPCLGYFPLHFALRRHEESKREKSAADAILDFLLEKASSPDAIQCIMEAGKYPLHVACTSHSISTSVLSKLMVPEALEHKDNYGFLPIHYACERALPAALTVLVEAAPGTIQGRVTGRPNSYGYCQSIATGRTPLILLCASKAATISQIDFVLEAWPEGLKVADDEGALPLHHAANFHGPNPSVVQHVLDLWPEAIKIATTKTNELPLHFLSLRGDGVDLLKYMISLYPEAVTSCDAEGMWPIHRMLKNSWSSRRLCLEAVQALVERSPESLLIQSTASRYNPLHELCDRVWANKQNPYKLILDYLVEKEPKSLLQKNDKGQIPLHVAIELGMDGWFLESLLMKFPTDQSSACDNRGRMTLQIQLEAANKWSGSARTEAQNAERCRMLLTHFPAGAFQPDLNGTMAFPFQEHLVSRLFTNTQEGDVDYTEKVRMMLMGYAYGTLDLSYDRYDQDVLHAACVSPCPDAILGRLITVLGEEGVRRHDRNGRFPLPLALEAGKIQAKLIAPLIDPKVMTTRDIKTGFFPFQLAAVAASKSTDDGTSSSSAEELSTVYTLIRECPRGWGGLDLAERQLSDNNEDAVTTNTSPPCKRRKL